MIYLLPLGGFLPRDVTDQFRSATDVGRWLEANGFRVIATIEGPGNVFATTADGARVYRNGYCCKAPDVEVRA